MPLRFDSSAAATLSTADELTCMRPAFVRSLSSQFEVELLAARLSPVLLDDHSVAIFSLAEHVGGDQADELERRVLASGYRLSNPARYILAAPLLLAVARSQITPQSLASNPPLRFEQSRTALAEAFQDLLEWGLRHDASDIHLNVRLNEPESEVKYTVSGRYLAPDRFRRMPTTTLVDMLSVAWMDIRGGNGAVFDPYIEQQGSLVKQVDGQSIMLRWASLAADDGPSVCLRLLRRDTGACLPGLKQLGYLADQIAVIDRVMLSEGGVVVMAGTVGSGKSTSLASLISRLPAHRKIITLEEPVEYLIPASIQNSVARNLNAVAHQSYASKLRALKRSAMTDVLLGEIRDVETGQAFMDLAGSGVNVYTTVHAPSAAHIPLRLASDFIGISADFLATPGILKLMVFQALLPVLCQQCALPASALQNQDRSFASQPQSGRQWGVWLDLVRELYACSGESWRIRNPDGCDACRKDRLPELNGYAGRTVVAEINEPPGGLHQQRPAMACAMHKAGEGLIDLRDIEIRFHAFETQQARRALQNDDTMSTTRLRMVT
ncbi:Flp pilus assembly complex ATPase component TadA [Alcaligenaceae bacterium]|nr:Flp pilus assembly complex ATPase component TadA [Alcaligenaceae bacterium]